MTTDRPNPTPPNGHARRPAPREADPVAVFLGPEATRSGPFGVLGLPVGPLTEDEIIAAVHRAIARVDAHPQSRGPEAGEARLAVHAAAVQLLDDAVRAELIARLAGSRPAGDFRPASAPAVASPPPSSVRVPAASPAALQALALRAIAAEGGWGPGAMRRFVRIAHARGFTHADATAAITAMASGRTPAPTPAPAASASPAGATPPAVGRGPNAFARGAAVSASPRTASQAISRVTEPATPADASDAPAPHRVPRVEHHDASADPSGLSPTAALGIVGLALLAMAVGAVIVLGNQRPSAPDAEPAAPVAAASPAPPPAQPRARRDQPAEPAERPLDNAPAVLHELEVATEGVALDLDASLTTFTRAVRATAVRWTTFSAGDRIAIQDAIVGYFYRIGGQASLAERAFASLEEGTAPVRAAGAEVPTPDAVARAVWSLGTVARLGRERNLPAAVDRRVDAVLLGLVDGSAPAVMTFRAGAIAAAGALVDRLADAAAKADADRDRLAACWQRWIECVRASTSLDPERADAIIREAIDRLVRRHDSAEGVLASPVPLLIAELDWGPGAGSRRWFTRAFDDRSLSPEQMHALTVAVSTRSAAEGVSPSMVLSRNASDLARRDMAARYREAWGIASEARHPEILAEFFRLADERLAEPPRFDGRDDVHRLADGVETARLVTAAAHLWRGEAEAAADVLATPRAGITTVVGNPTDPDLDSLFAARDGAWAEAYLAAGANIPQRTGLLRSLAARGGSLSPMEADVVADQAFRGSPQSIRDAAAAIVETSAAEPTVINAVLEILPRVPGNPRNRTLIEIVAGIPLPDTDDPDWPAASRRAVVERLLASIAGAGRYARLDALAALLDETYEARLTGPSTDSAAGVPQPAEVSARALTDRWVSSAERAPGPGPSVGTVTDVARGRAARLAMARGVVQAFHVEQVTLAEAMAIAVAGEQPDRVRDVARLLARHRADRADPALARDILTQIDLTERFILALWRIRFEGDAA